jgi:hypothetical protein
MRLRFAGGDAFEQGKRLLVATLQVADDIGFHVFDGQGLKVHQYRAIDPDFLKSGRNQSASLIIGAWAMAMPHTCGATFLSDILCLAFLVFLPDCLRVASA